MNVNQSNDEIICEIADIVPAIIIGLHCRVYWLYEGKDPNDIVEQGTLS